MSPTPARAAGVADIAVGSGWSCALLDDGQVECWGGDYRSAFAAARGRKPLAPPADRFVQIDGGRAIACGVTISGGMRCWGGEDYVPKPERPNDTDWASVSVPPDGFGSELVSVCGLTTQGAARCVGSPSRPADRSGPYVQVITASNHQACGVDAGGRVTCWGKEKVDFDDHGPADLVVKVKGWGCWRHSETGALRCFGREKDGRTRPPAGVWGAVAADRYACGVRGDGELRCWGVEDGEDAVDRRVAPPGRYTVVDVGPRHACAVTTAGGVRCWGNGGNGELAPPWPEAFGGDQATQATRAMLARQLQSGAHYMPVVGVDKIFAGQGGLWRVEKARSATADLRLRDEGLERRAVSVLVEEGAAGAGTTGRSQFLYVAEADAWRVQAIDTVYGDRAFHSPVMVLPSALIEGAGRGASVDLLGRNIPGLGTVLVKSAPGEGVPYRLSVVGHWRTVTLPSNKTFRYVVEVRWESPDADPVHVLYAPKIGEIGRRSSDGHWQLWLTKLSGPKELRASVVQGDGPMDTAKCAGSASSDCVEAAAQVLMAQAPGDPVQAVTLLEQACHGDDALACQLTGMYLAGAVRHPALAARFFATGCNLGGGAACGLLADQQLDGRGVPQNGLAAYNNFGRGCAAGCASCCTKAGDLVAKGMAGPPDAEQSQDWTVRGCQAGDDKACARLPLSFRQKVQQHDALVDGLQGRSSSGSGLPVARIDRWNDVVVGSSLPRRPQVTITRRDDGSYVRIGYLEGGKEGRYRYEVCGETVHGVSFAQSFLKKGARKDWEHASKDPAADAVAAVVGTIDALVRQGWTEGERARSVVQRDGEPWVAMQIPLSQGALRRRIDLLCDGEKPKKTRRCDVIIASVPPAPCGG
jgi:hypothetical protein